MISWGYWNRKACSAQTTNCWNIPMNSWCKECLFCAINTPILTVGLQASCPVKNMFTYLQLFTHIYTYTHILHIESYRYVIYDICDIRYYKHVRYSFGNYNCWGVKLLPMYTYSFWGVWSLSFKEMVLLSTIEDGWTALKEVIYR